MSIAKHRSPNLKWSFELPDRLKFAIADAIVLYSRIESCCIEIIWELEQANLECKKQIAKAIDACLAHSRGAGRNKNKRSATQAGRIVLADNEDAVAEREALVGVIGDGSV